MPQKRKIDFLNYIIIGLLILVNFFWLPSFSRSTPVSKTATPIDSKFAKFLDYSPPIIPTIKSQKLSPLLATSYILIDVDTNSILLEKDIHSRVYPASITKLATAMTVLSLYPLEEELTIEKAYNNGN